MEEKEYPLLMQELGFVISPTGEEMKFGNWKPAIRRMDEQDYHTEAFQKQVIATKRYEKLGVLLNENFDITSQCPFLAQNGIIVGLNQTDGSFTPSVPNIFLLFPSAMSEEQIKKMIEKKEELLQFEPWLHTIRIIDSKKNTVDRVGSINEFYEKYVYPQVREISKQGR